MSGIRVFRSVLALVIILAVLRAVPAYSWHGSGSITALAIDPVTPATLYAGTPDRGVFKSMDGGATWSSTGLNIGVGALAIDPRTPSTLYAAAGPWWAPAGGVFRSTDGGATWSSTGLNIAVGPLAIDPLAPTTLYAGAFYAYKSTDGGATWSFSGLSDGVQALAIDPLTPTTVYAGTDLNYGGEGESDPEMIRGGVFKSTDSGASWSTTSLADIPVSALAIDPRTPTTLYAVIETSYAGLHKSTDGGATWSWAAAGLTNVLFRALAIDPLTPTTLYAGTESGVLKSTDGGATWSAVNAGLTDTLLAFGLRPIVGPLAIDPLVPNTVYAGTPIGVFKSTDGGPTWSPSGLIQHSPLQSVSLNPTSVAAGTPSTGTVTLITPAPAEGVVVALFSTNTAVATVPASVTVPAGVTSATFTVSTSSNPPSTGTLMIKATFDDAFRGATFHVTPAPLSSVSLNPTSVTGETPSTGTVSLSAAAPAEGAAVTLSSSNPALATVPASVTVAAGATSVNFTVSTSAVTATTTVTISATYGGTTRSAELTVIPATTLSSVSLNPTSVTAGSTSTGTVTLNGAAPTGGAVVALANSDSAVATAPASVMVAAGATSANFTVSTFACTPGSATISGTYGGVTMSAGLTVTLPTRDTVTIQLADYFINKQELRVAAKSTSSTATLQVLVTSSGELIGTLPNLGDGKYGGRFTWPVNPQNITVGSSSCGSATRAVTLK